MSVELYWNRLSMRDSSRCWTSRRRPNGVHLDALEQSRAEQTRAEQEDRYIDTPLAPVLRRARGVGNIDKGGGMNHDQIDAELQRLSGCYPRQRPTPQQVQEFHRAFEPLDALVVNDAVSEYIDANEYFPKVSNILALCRHPGAADGVRADRHDCPTCDGTGLVDAPTPPGEVTPGESWMARCSACAGRGWLPGPAPVATGATPSDEALVAMWAAEGIARRQDGRLYRVADGRVIHVRPPESAMPPLPDGTRPATPAVDDAAAVREMTREATPAPVDPPPPPPPPPPEAPPEDDPTPIVPPTPGPEDYPF